MKTPTRFLCAAWMVLTSIAGSPTPCAADTVVMLKPDFETTKPTVRLSDLFSGVPAAIDRDIAQAPPLCKDATYDEPVLNKLAETYRLDWQAPNGKKLVIVTSACARITSDMIRDAVLTRMKEDGQAKRQNIEITLDSRTLEIALPANASTDFKLENFAYDPVNKHFRTSLVAETARGPSVTAIAGRAIIKRNVPVLVKRLEGGTTLGAADLDWIQVPDERVGADVVTEPTQLIGRELRRDTPEGEILRARDIMPARLVQRGALVTMKIETPFISITSQGKAQQDGAEGDTVRVLNTQSNRMVEGLVVAPGVVEIRTTQKIAAAE